MQDGEAIPEPSSLESIIADAESRSAVAILVRCALPPQKTVRVNITLPDDVLSAIDRYAESHGYSRSGFIAKAARDALKLEDT